MATSRDGRFAAKIIWLPFQNNTGQQIPPFSCIEASGWLMPDISGSGPDAGQPIIQAMQPSEPVNPFACYLTNAVTTPAGGYGLCARPDAVPQLAAIGSNGDSGGAGQIEGICGPTDQSWSLLPGSSGFLAVSQPQQGYALVVLGRGPFLGQVQGSSGSGSGGGSSGSGSGGSGGTGDSGGGGSGPQTIPSPGYAPIDLYLGSKGSETDGQVTYQVYNRFGQLTAGQWVIFDWIDQGWELIAPSGGAGGIVRGQLLGPLAKGGSAQFQDFQKTPKTYTVYEALQLNDGSFPASAILDITYNAITSHWEVLQPLPQSMQMVLNGALTQGGNAQATGVDGATYTVFEALGTNNGNSIASGTKIFATYSLWKNRFEVSAAGCSSGR